MYRLHVAQIGQARRLAPARKAPAAFPHFDRDGDLDG